MLCRHALSCCIYTALVSLLFSTSFKILMEMFLLPCFTGFSLYRKSRMPYYVSIKAYNSTVHEFCAVQYVKASWVCRGHPYIESECTGWRRKFRGEGSAGREG